MEGIVIIGQKKNCLGGPSGIIDGLVNAYSRMGVPCKIVRLEEGTNKLKYLFKVINTVRRSKNYAINAHTGSFLLCLFVYFLSKIYVKDRSYYLTVHGIHRAALRIDGKKDFVNEWIEAFLFRKFLNLICVSEVLRNDIQRDYARKNNIYVVPNATDIENYKIKKNRFSNSTLHFVLFGGISRIKGVMECLALMAFLKEHVEVPLSLDIYGKLASKMIEDEYEAALIDYGLQDYVHYRGQVHTKEEIANILSEATFQLCLSHYDSFNVAVIEGMVVGCPAICSLCCGASCFIKSEINGLTVDLKENYLERIYHYIKKSISDAEFYQSQCENAIRVAPHVRWENAAKTCCKIMGVEEINYESDPY